MDCVPTQRLMGFDPVIPGVSPSDHFDSAHPDVPSMSGYSLKAKPDVDDDRRIIAAHIAKTLQIQEVFFQLLGKPPTEKDCDARDRNAKSLMNIADSYSIPGHPVYERTRIWATSNLWGLRKVTDPHTEDRLLRVKMLVQELMDLEHFKAHDLLTDCNESIQEVDADSLGGRIGQVCWLKFHSDCGLTIEKFMGDGPTPARDSV